MKKEINIILKKCLGLRKSESFLVVTDSILFDIGVKFLFEAVNITKKVKLVTIPVAKVSGTEPPRGIAKEMLKYDTLLLITKRSLSHTKARKKASKKGIRTATMPGTTEEMIRRAIDIDYKKLKEEGKKISKVLDLGKNVRIVTELGTDISFSINGRKSFGLDSGIYTKKGAFGNLPEGEIFIAPVEGTANGIFVSDASFASIGKLKKALKVIVNNGFASEFKGYKAGFLAKTVDSVGKKGRNIAEFGIGINPKAKITGNTLEDEKVRGTVHIALGNNTGFGGKTDVELHLDGIIKKPTIIVDNVTIMKKGRFVFSKHI